MCFLGGLKGRSVVGDGLSKGFLGVVRDVWASLAMVNDLLCLPTIMVAAPPLDELPFSICLHVRTVAEGIASRFSSPSSSPTLKNITIKCWSKKFRSS